MVQLAVEKNLLHVFGMEMQRCLGHFSRKTMGRYVFKDILHFIGIEGHEARLQRRSTDRLVTIREVWEIFTKNCQKLFIVRTTGECRRTTSRFSRKIPAQGLYEKQV